MHDNPSCQLELYKRFIDDILIIWKGNKESLEEFLTRLNQNDRNITLTWQIDAKQIQFLDLEISIDNNQLITKTHFKEVARNSYLPITSCHYKPWLFNIPKGQLVRIRRNCTKESDFKIQADLIGKRFIEKGYTSEFISKQIQSVQSLDRSSIIHGQKKSQSVLEAPALVLDFNVQYKDIEKILKKYWYILKGDQHPQSILPDKPVIMYKRATTLRDLIMRNVVDPPSSNPFSFFNGQGFFFHVNIVLHANILKNFREKKNSFWQQVPDTHIQLKILLVVTPRGLSMSSNALANCNM